MGVTRATARLEWRVAMVARVQRRPCARTLCSTFGGRDTAGRMWTSGSSPKMATGRNGPTRCLGEASLARPWNASPDGEVAVPLLLGLERRRSPRASRRLFHMGHRAGRSLFCCH
jgi:hypothetical protein